jgi:glucokinase
LGNLPWHDEPLQADAEKIFNCPLMIEHDSALGGLSESMLLPENKRVLYVTISTGIGTGLIDHRSIVPELADSEGGQMLLEYRGKHVKWESFASGRAIVERFGKKAAEIDDDATWQRIAHDLAQGFIELIAITQPDIIVIGGSVGRYFDRFKVFLEQEVTKYRNPLVPIPAFQQAVRPDDAVLYGCYDLAMAHYGTNT